MPIIGSDVKKDESFRKNEAFHRKALKELAAKAEAVQQGGGDNAMSRHRKKGKLSARERIGRLIDAGSVFHEIGLFGAYGMYEEFGGAPSTGTIVGIGTVHRRHVVIVANDATVKAGAWFPMTAKKNLRAQEIAMENRLPIIYLVDSAGVFLPLQSEIFPDREHFGRIFRNNAVMSAMGITQIAAIMGPCVAGGAYLPIMSDESLIVDKTGSVFLAGSHLVKAAIGEEIDNEALGGATVQTEISGVVDRTVKNDTEAIAAIRRIIATLGHFPVAGFNYEKPAAPAFDPREIYGILPTERNKPYDTYQILGRLLDRSELDEYKPGYGKTVICGYGRIGGWAVGVVANQRSVVKTRQGEMQVGGVIYSDSADKAARFILNCNQRHIPLVFIQDVTGFMVGSRSEHGGIIKDGAKMVNAVANATVPKFTIIAGNSYGAGNYAMCGKAYDPRLIFGWHTAQIAVMGGRQASETLLSIKVQAMEKGGAHITEEEQRRMLDEIQAKYEQELDPLFAASRLWVDGIIDPLDTRAVLATGIAAANCNPDIPPMRTGVIQM